MLNSEIRQKIFLGNPALRDTGHLEPVKHAMSLEGKYQGKGILKGVRVSSPLIIPSLADLGASLPLCIGPLCEPLIQS